jgi:hypothetical protein
LYNIANPDDPEVLRLRRLAYVLAVQAAPLVHKRPEPSTKAEMPKR